VAANAAVVTIPDTAFTTCPAASAVVEMVNFPNIPARDSIAPVAPQSHMT
jgi:hypothetical protein